ncbi:hypothetical protein BKA69DRAFT_1080266 [Paraphysoderma sedebokerense]|nr:hypothetical protein BKA69DRAFT_1080266 [Paraphysoderma sedebokerense]
MKFNIKFLFVALFLAQLALTHAAPVGLDVAVSVQDDHEDVIAIDFEEFDGSANSVQSDMRLNKRQGRGGGGGTGRGAGGTGVGGRTTGTTLQKAGAVGWTSSYGISNLGDGSWRGGKLREA